MYAVLFSNRVYRNLACDCVTVKAIFPAVAPRVTFFEICFSYFSKYRYLRFNGHTLTLTVPKK